MERKLIGAGRTSEVYEYGDDCILKLFTDEIKLDMVKKEYDFSRFAYENDLPTPEPKEIMYEKDRIEILYEKINGEPLLKIAMMNVLAIKKILSKMAELQYKINSMEYDNGAYTFKKYLERAIEENIFITGIEKKNMKEYINKLPGGNKVCHGDFHPENILCSNGKYYIIDWMTGMQGPPAADVARTEMILKNAEIPGRAMFFIKILIRIVQSKMAKMYVKEYCRISGMKKNELDIWRLPLYVARLNEKNSKKEEERLMKIIRKLENQAL
ncbi:MAG: phosphotransferase [Treponema sp.]|jgi:uncharacterized protein (TIGR02172 family)|nr:phosphotransferase [Treponema sp.]